MAKQDQNASLRPHTAIFLVLYLPFGIASGYSTVTLAYLLSQAGVSAAAIAGVGALTIFPLTWSVLWLPILDLILS